MRRTLRRAAFAAVVLATPMAMTELASADPRCPLKTPASDLKHIVFMEFDNLHLERDVPNVPSDLEQLPHLFEFLTTHGFLSANHHTVQISHTANGFLTPQAGIYSGRLGSAVSNSFHRFNEDGSIGRSVSLFVYWTDQVSSGVPVLVDERGKNAPAPWPAFTRVGCDVGYIGITGAVLENVTADLDTVFGADSAQAQEGRSDKDRAGADFVGISLHCAKASALCAGSEAVADRLPDQPGGYEGYKAIFGNMNIAPKIGSGGPLKDLDGNPIQDSKGNPGFPGFDRLLPSTSLAYAAQVLEAGVPIVNVYASDAHDDHVRNAALGPGTPDYQAQLAAYDRAFGSFFDRLKRDGIDETNTLFVFTTDESDHFVGSPPTPPDCDGVYTPCTYSKIGEITADIRRLVFEQRHNGTPFAVHADSAPAIYVDGNPAQGDPATRNLERDLLSVTVLNPLTDETITLGAAAVDQAGIRFLHMGSSDPARMPTFVFYQHEDFFGTASSAATPPPCSMDPPCIREDSHYAYNHGDFQEDIRTTWLGMVGPGVRSLGLTDLVWSDHVDVRPTILTLAGITSDYVHDGRTVVEYIRPERLPPAAAANFDQLVQLGNAYKEIAAPFQALGLAMLNASTRALKSKDAEYALFQQRVGALTAARDDLAGRVRAALEDALFRNIANPANLHSLTNEAQLFLIRARSQLR